MSRSLIWGRVTHSLYSAMCSRKRQTAAQIQRRGEASAKNPQSRFRCPKRSDNESSVRPQGAHAWLRQIERAGHRTSGKQRSKRSPVITGLSTIPPRNQPRYCMWHCAVRIAQSRLHPLRISVSSQPSLASVVITEFLEVAYGTEGKQTKSQTRPVTRETRRGSPTGHGYPRRYRVLRHPWLAVEHGRQASGEVKPDGVPLEDCNSVCQRIAKGINRKHQQVPGRSTRAWLNRLRRAVSRLPISAVPAEAVQVLTEIGVREVLVVANARS